MPQIKIISASVRTGRNSHRVALFLRNYLEKNNLASVEILDLKEYNFPLFSERLQNLKEPPPGLVDFAGKIKAADGIIIVFPEYNGGISASLKNAIDVLYNEWIRKPIALASCSNGPFGGSQAMMWTQFTLWKIGAWTVPVRFQASFIDTKYSEDGIPEDKESTEKSAAHFIKELIWAVNLGVKSKG